MAKYKIIGGPHVGSYKAANGVDTQVIIPPGNVIELNGTPDEQMPDRYQKMPDDTPVTWTPPKESKTPATTEGAVRAAAPVAGNIPEKQDFNAMTVKEIHEFAAENEVDLKGAKHKDEMIQVLQSAGY